MHVEDGTHEKGVWSVGPLNLVEWWVNKGKKSNSNRGTVRLHGGPWAKIETKINVGHQFYHVP